MQGKEETKRWKRSRCRQIWKWTEGQKRNGMKVGKREKWLWDEVNSAQWLGSGFLFINESLDFTALLCDCPSLLMATHPIAKAQTKRRRDWWQSILPPHPSPHYHRYWSHLWEGSSHWPRHSSWAGDEVRLYSWPSLCCCCMWVGESDVARAALEIWRINTNSCVCFKLQFNTCMLSKNK